METATADKAKAETVAEASETAPAEEQQQETDAEVAEADARHAAEARLRQLVESHAAFLTQVRESHLSLNTGNTTRRNHFSSWGMGPDGLDAPELVPNEFGMTIDDYTAAGLQRITEMRISAFDGVRTSVRNEILTLCRRDYISADQRDQFLADCGLPPHTPEYLVRIGLGFSVTATDREAADQVFDKIRQAFLDAGVPESELNSAMNPRWRGDYVTIQEQ